MKVTSAIRWALKLAFLISNPFADECHVGVQVLPFAAKVSALLKGETMPSVFLPTCSLTQLRQKLDVSSGAAFSHAAMASGQHREGCKRLQAERWCDATNGA